MSLALSRWVEDGSAILVTGPAGSGKSWLACALAQYACRRGHSAYCTSACPASAEELRVLHGSGGFGKWLIQLAKTDVLLLDDWGMAALDAQARSDLLEIIDDRAASKATIITSQLPIEHWHAWVGDATIADAILDRPPSRSQRINAARRFHAASQGHGRATSKTAPDLQTQPDGATRTARLADSSNFKPSKTE